VVDTGLPSALPMVTFNVLFCSVAGFATAGTVGVFASVQNES
jgi:hypothetical protein